MQDFVQCDYEKIDSALDEIKSADLDEYTVMPPLLCVLLQVFPTKRSLMARANGFLEEEEVYNAARRYNRHFRAMAGESLAHIDEVLNDEDAVNMVEKMIADGVRFNPRTVAALTDPRRKYSRACLRDVFIRHGLLQN